MVSCIEKKIILTVKFINFFLKALYIFCLKTLSLNSIAKIFFVDFKVSAKPEGLIWYHTAVLIYFDY